MGPTAAKTHDSRASDLSPAKQPEASPSTALRSANSGALGVLVKISTRKRFLIRTFEAAVKPLVFLVEWLRRAEPSRSGEIRQILVVEYWNLGDIVMESPFLQNLRIEYPAAHIVLLTSPKCAPLIENQGLVDEVKVVRVPWTQHYSRWRKYNPFSPLWLELLKTLKTLRTQSFDLAFVARADIRENFILWLIRARQRVGYGFGGGAFLLTDVVLPDLERPHFSNRWLRLLEHLGKPILTLQPRLLLTGEEELAAERFLADRGVKDGDFLVGVHSGARSAIRQWGEENFEAVARGLQKQFAVKILWFQEPNHSSPAPARNHDFLPLSLPLRPFMAVLRRCRLFICNDSGPMHIATALGVPVVAVFGPTEPAWFGPLGPANRIVIQHGFWCRPCYDYCLFDQPYCLRTISIESVYQAAVGVVRDLDRPPSSSEGRSSVFHKIEGPSEEERVELEAAVRNRMPS
jgi:lipopolysaccharide heptosyltransferase II